MYNVFVYASCDHEYFDSASFNLAVSCALSSQSNPSVSDDDDGMKKVKKKKLSCNECTLYDE